MEERLHVLYCPVCGSQTGIKINQNTVLLHFPLLCPNCGKETCVNVVEMNMVTDEK